MDKTCLQAGDLGNGKIEWLNRDGKGGFEELWRERESNDGFGGGGGGGGIRMPLENLLAEKASY